MGLSINEIIEINDSKKHGDLMFVLSMSKVLSTISEMSTLKWLLWI